MYPLCIDTIEKIGGIVHNIDGTCGKITCVEGIHMIQKLWQWLIPVYVTPVQ